MRSYHNPGSLNRLVSVLLSLFVLATVTTVASPAFV